jgi:NADH-quinone oxidoreductase subunit G
MPKCTIDGRQVEFQPGENLIEVAKKAGIEIPYFCYHPGLSVVAQCRMCTVEIEKNPKLQTACSTPAAEGMVVLTNSEKAKKNQRSVMEFLLVNHPLDCPICDKAGECDLQDNSYKFGDAYMRTSEDRRTYMDLDMGPVIKKNMNRCIHCTRCIRFGAEVAGIREMVAIQRGNNTEITTIDGRPLETDYAGNYSDICPTGSLTLKDFRFKKRAWFLKKTATVCEGCSRGCNMEVQQEGNVIYRCIPRENKEVNQWWMCDEGRFNYRYTMEKSRVTDPRVNSPEKGLVPADWPSAITAARNLLQGKKTLILAGSDLTQEEIVLLQAFAKQALAGAEIRHFGTPGVRTAQEDAAADKLLKRKSKTANLHGLEKLGVQPFDGSLNGAQAVLVVRGGRASLPSFSQLGSAPLVGIGVYQSNETKGLSAILPGAAFTEKDGTIVNFQGKEQKIRRAVLPPGKAKALSEILALWTHQGQQSTATPRVASASVTGGAV